jgi:hypothetical protein
MTLYDRNGCPTPTLVNSDEYRENYDRIFGKKKKAEPAGPKCLACNDSGVIKTPCEMSLWYEEEPCKACEAKDE